MPSRFEEIKRYTINFYRFSDGHVTVMNSHRTRPLYPINQHRHGCSCEEAMASTAMVLTYFPSNIPTSALERLNRHRYVIYIDRGSIHANHNNEVIMSTKASKITSITIVYSTVYSGADQRKLQSPASLAFVRGIHRWPVNSPHKWPVTRKKFPFDDVIMTMGNL